MAQRSFGICVGAANTKYVEMVFDESGPRLGRKVVVSHDCDPFKAVRSLVREQTTSIPNGAITGRITKQFSREVAITEAEAIEYALRFSGASGSREKTAVVSLGAESFIAYGLDADGTIGSVESGNKCASGTGEFLVQQVGRLDMRLEEAIASAGEWQPHQVSGRCSVFCKSDCTHAVNRGIPAGRVVAGLFAMTAARIMDLLDKMNCTRVIAVGGVAQNRAVMDILRAGVKQLVIPDHAEVFEALGAALYARETRSRWKTEYDGHTEPAGRSFSTLPRISTSESLVTFASSTAAQAGPGDTIVIGLDVGSTTTKAVAMRTGDAAVVGSVYLRTNGNPVRASRACYRELAGTLDRACRIKGIGTTGSGRQIAALHAGTDIIVNEIIAHAAAAAFYNKEVDTIFEIGGQDAKYTYLAGGVPSDYAMNEACSAGTGSFLEESARETLGISHREIQTFAMDSDSPADFSAQCAAFISSDIKTAIHESIPREDIVAGLVYSICMNYVERVKGQRPVGKVIFMQGGVCYNRAVPLAMANLIGKPIIVPPDPGLAGAFGAALEARAKTAAGEPPRAIDLQELAGRDIAVGKPFTCNGGNNGCDRRCEIEMIIIEGKKYPFGGACNRYYNAVHSPKLDTEPCDFIQERNRLVFENFAPLHQANGASIGLNRSFLVNSLYPLYATFFSELGMRVVVSDCPRGDGRSLARTSLCYPAELAHRAFRDLIEKKTDYVFLPSVVELPAEDLTHVHRENQCTCVLLQSEPYYLQSAFRETAPASRIIAPTLDFSRGFAAQKEAFLHIGAVVGRKRSESEAAFEKALERQQSCLSLLQTKGREFLETLEQNPSNFAIVLLGRSYNAFAAEANLAIPAKFSSRGIPAVPWEYLPAGGEFCGLNMCWSLGREIIKAARFVSRHPQLYAVYITNFGCGPDSFLVTHVREIMGPKPSLTLELDSHSADAGITTRVEAFIDIVRSRRNDAPAAVSHSTFMPARLDYQRGRQIYTTSAGKKLPLASGKVQVVYPPMGRLMTELAAACCEGAGMPAQALPTSTSETLKLGRSVTSGKECLPLILSAGSLLRFVRDRKDTAPIAFFMPTCRGNCRFTQYTGFFERLIEKQRIENVALLSLSNEKGYGGLPLLLYLNLLKTVIIADGLDDVRNALRVLAQDPERSLEVFEAQWRRVLELFRSGKGRSVSKLLASVAGELRKIPLRSSLSSAKTVLLTGEIFIRRDDFSCRGVIDKLVSHGIIVRRAPIFEWLLYCDFCVQHGLYEARFDLFERLGFFAKIKAQQYHERRIKRILAASGLLRYEEVDIPSITEYGRHFFDLRFTGEAMLVVGSFFRDILHSVHGVINIGPFGCMHTRVADAVLSADATMEMKHSIEGHPGTEDAMSGKLPFLSVESDGSPLSPLLDARLEAFCLKIKRVHERLHPERIQAGTEKERIETETARAA
jgi:predicted CoA-substrate-specific enzyme activase